MSDLGRVDGPITLDEHDRVTLKVLLDAAVPREPGGPMDWEGAGRRHAESLLGFRSPCICRHVPDNGTVQVPGCEVHDPEDTDFPIRDRCGCGPQNDTGPMVYHRRGGRRCRATGSLR